MIKRLYVMADRYKQKRIQLSERQAAQAADMLVSRSVARGLSLSQFPTIRLHCARIHNVQTTPKLSARSRQLATKKRRQPERSKSVRLCPCCARVPSDCTQQQQNPRRVEFKSADAIYEKHVRWQQQREARRLVEKQRNEEAQLQECTFRNPWYRSAWDPIEEEPKRSDNEAFYRRSMAWAAQREQTLDAEKKVWRELEMMECTFKPHVPRRSEATGATQPSTRGENHVTYARKIDGRVSGDPRRRSEALYPEATHLADYTATDLEALASTSCLDYSTGHSDYQGEGDDEHSDNSDRALLFLRFSCADAREFAGR